MKVTGVLLLTVLISWCSAASAGQGWYLMLPPPMKGSEKGSEVPDNFRPVRDWWQNGAYDSARECQNAKVELVDRLDRLSGYAQRPVNFMQAQYILAVCIASDDPRLK